MKKVIFSLLLCFTILTRQAHANDIIIATNPTWPPFEMLDINNNIVGYEIDLMSAITMESGFKAKFISTPWDGIFTTLELKKCDIIAACVTMTENRKRRYLFSEPIYGFVQAFVVLEESLIKAPKDLEGKRIGVLIGSTALVVLNKIDANFDIATYDDIGLALEDIKNRNLDAVICDDPVARHYSNRKKGYKEKMKIGFMTNNPEYIGFVVLKSNQELMDKLKAGHKKIIENGKQKEIFEKWFGTESF